MCLQGSLSKVNVEEKEEEKSEMRKAHLLPTEWEGEITKE